MIIFDRNSINTSEAKGRILQKVLGSSGAACTSDEMIAIFARFAPEYGVMDTHYHEAEFMYVIDAKDAVASYGDTLSDMDQVTLRKGDILCPHNGEWHRFDFTSSDGYVDFINFFAVPESHVVEARGDHDES